MLGREGERCVSSPLSFLFSLTFFERTVHPDFLFSFQPYSSNSDVLPTAQQAYNHPPPIPSPAQLQASRVVYASTLSSFPPRPPLRPRTPELTPASRIIAEYRALHGTLTPSVRGGADGEEEEEEELVDSEADETPTPGHGGAQHHSATPVAEEEPVTVTATADELNTSTSTAHPTALHINPFSDASASPRLILPLSDPSSPSSSHSHSSAYSTPASEAVGFAFSDGGRQSSEVDRCGSGSEGHEAREEDHGGEGAAGGVAMSSEGSATSLESMSAPREGGELKRPLEGRERKVSGMTRTTMTTTEGEEEWRECEE